MGRVNERLVSDEVIGKMRIEGEEKLFDVIRWTHKYFSFPIFIHFSDSF